MNICTATKAAQEKPLIKIVAKIHGDQQRLDSSGPPRESFPHILILNWLHGLNVPEIYGCPPNSVRLQ